MNERDLLEAELRAVREELARRELQRHPDDRSAMVAPRDGEFLRLKTLRDDHLEAHEDRLERDLEDLTAGLPADAEMGDEPASNPDAATDD